MDDCIIHFTIGSCPLVTIYPYFMLYQAYNNLTDEEKENSPVSFSTLCITLPVIYGLLLAAVYQLTPFVPRKVNNSIYFRFIVAGAISTTLVSILLQSLFDIHRKWFKVENPINVHIAVFMFYLVFYYTVGQWFRAQILYGVGAPKPSFFPKSKSPVVAPPPVTTETSASLKKLEQLEQKISK